MLYSAYSTHEHTVELHVASTAQSQTAHSPSLASQCFDVAVKCVAGCQCALPLHGIDAWPALLLDHVGRCIDPLAYLRENSLRRTEVCGDGGIALPRHQHETGPNGTPIDTLMHLQVGDRSSCWTPSLMAGFSSLC